ncbi:MAG TPA: response regulator [Myxococcales bacterium]|nr:response regulator [Myxococcales bacterium]
MGKAQQPNILVVDSDEGSTMELKSMLVDAGYSAGILTEPERVVEELRTNRYQLVILDVSPGNPAGIAALQAIRVFDADLCVIATTGLASVEMAVETMKHQAFHYLQKPLDEEELAMVLAEAVKAKGLVINSDAHVNRAVGRRLRECRQSQPLTLKQLANRTGKSVSLLSQIELGKSAASVSTLNDLSNALGVKMTFFFETV